VDKPIIIQVSNQGDDAYDGSEGKPVRSWERLKMLCTGNTEILLKEGKATLERLKSEIED
jgi:hypothetical protein